MSKKTDLSDVISAIENNNDDDNVKIIQNYLGEYLKCCILLGYSHSGESIIVINGKTEQDFHSIESLMRRYSSIEFNSEETITEEGVGDEE